MTDAADPPSPRESVLDDGTVYVPESRALAAEARVQALSDELERLRKAVRQNGGRPNPVVGDV
jgi:hypothetical protein